MQRQNGWEWEGQGNTWILQLCSPANQQELLPFPGERRAAHHVPNPLQSKDQGAEWDSGWGFHQPSIDLYEGLAPVAITDQ